MVEGTAFFSFSQAFLALKVREQETTLLVSRATSGRKEAKSKPQAPWERLRGQAAGGGGCQRGFREKLADGAGVVVDLVLGGEKGGLDGWLQEGGGLPRFGLGQEPESRERTSLEPCFHVPGWGADCLCGAHPKYAQRNTWVEGAILATLGLPSLNLLVEEALRE